MRERVHAGAGGDAPAACRRSAPGRRSSTFGIISGWKIIFLVCVASSVMTPARPTSEPVPAVVGTATIGAMPFGSARVHQSPTSSKSHIGRVCPAMKAIDLAGVERRAAAEGDDAVVPAGAQRLEAGLDIGRDRVGLDSREDGRGRPAAASASSGALTSACRRGAGR